MLTSVAFFFGALFLVLGILGFIPAISPGGYLFGIFAVGPVHNFFHLFTGGAAVLMAVGGESGARLFFQIFGVIYAIVAAIGVFFGDDPWLGFMAHNWPDFWLHVVVALGGLALGYIYRPTPSGHRSASPRAR